MYAEKKLFEQALKDFDQAIAIGPADAMTPAVIGVCPCGMGRRPRLRPTGRKR